MRLIVIPPYQNPIVNWVFIIRGLLDSLEKKGQLKGVEVDVDEGYFTESTAESRDDEFKANISAGLIKKAKEYSEMGQYDAIIFTGGSDPAFAASRLASKIPVVGPLHSCLHVASLIGERCGHIHLSASGALAVRHVAESYGLSHKLASARYVNYSTTHIYKLLSKYKDNWEDRFKDPELGKILDDITTQCLASIEKDRVDTLVFSVEPIEALEDEIVRRLDEAGYDEIPIISGFSAAVELAKVMVNMKLVQAPRAYPDAALKAKPEYW
ncbi:aspartate/glutamate racemase family protein [Chloroflexota bacterium]